ncbi:cyclopropane fatty acyl phospholipid synthase [Patescibacteria group bacterium]|nr:cyclopropane fatty acyl phospholipid synthase [Patescibacteria group bacterium]
MAIINPKQTVLDLIGYADIKINGDRPWDIRVKNEDFYKRILSQASLGLGESYMDGWWETEALDVLTDKLLRAGTDKKVISFKALTNVVKARITNRQTKARSKKVAEIHYDLGNDFYSQMLDSRMQYTCGYWLQAENLEEAQEHKLDLICKKLNLNPEDHVLELGCGWGGFAKYAAGEYGCRVTGYNISQEQVKYARDNCQGLPVEIVEKDYREATGSYDKVVAIGLCEHIGYKNYRGFMEVAHKSLKDGGLFLVHTIGGLKSATSTDPWIEKYIFPNSMLPSPAQLAEALEGLFVLEDWHSFGSDYDKTLMAWFANFDRNWPKLREQYGERFYRMWKFYLLICAGSFRARKNQLWQVVLSKGGVTGGYQSVR